MPEIAECYSIAEKLPKNFTISKITISPQFKSLSNQQLEFFKLKNVKVLTPFAYGKSIWFPLEKNNRKGYLVAQLGMTGSWFNDNNLGERNSKHNHLEIMFNNHRLIYNDPRRFGSLSIYWGDDFELMQSKIIKTKNWGIDPLRNPEEVLKLIISRWSKSHLLIKALMLKQNVIFGIGNYLASEILYAAKISPLVKASQLSKEAYREIANQMIKIMLKSKKAGGFSFAGGYILPDGTYGNYYNKSLVYLKQTCRVCHNKINKIALDGRVTYFCGRCQKK